MRIVKSGWILLFTPGLVLQAQVSVRSGARTPATLQKASPNACSALLSPSPEIVRTPEGMMLLRLKKEFDGVASVVEQRNGTLERVDVRRLNNAQRDVDSLLQIYVRRKGGDSPNASVALMRRVDTVGALDDRARVERLIVESTRSDGVRAGSPPLEITLRDLSSQFAGFATVTLRAMNTDSPSGYIGIGLSGSQIRLMTDSGMYTTHCDLPVIETVDVGSPARRAGLVAGDTVTAYNGRDILTYSVNYPHLLVPGQALRIRVRREGKSRELPVTVGERPADLANAEVRLLSAPRRENVFFFPHPDDVQSIRVRTFPQGLSNSSGVMSFLFEATPLASVSGSATMGTIFGAQLNVIDDAFAVSLGLEPGILVMRVPAGSSSARAGLKPGEMIRAVNGVPVRDLTAIRRAIAVLGAREVKLTVMGRDTPARIVTVRW